MASIARWKELILPIGIIASILVILVPVPAPLMDLLLAANITIAVIVLLTTIHVGSPLEFSVFPSLLLATTLGRLVLNVATTRLILAEAPVAGPDAAGSVVRAFGDFVAGDQIVIGLVLFVIIFVIQFVVITKGATRISEVAARFALDGMPGRQMSIDADLSAGAIDEGEARRRRQELTDQADFHGAMDGAAKFVRGDAIAAVIITIVNVLGGLTLGVLQYGMSPVEAVGVFTKLTIGDGLASQLPALLVSLAAGLLMTRGTRGTNLPAEFLRQLFSRPEALAVAGVFLALLIFTRLPTLPLLTLAAACGGLALMLHRERAKAALAARATEIAGRPVKTPEQRIEDYLSVDPMEIELGLNLIRLADPKRGGDLLSRITRVRQAVAADVGIILPKVRVRDNMRLDESAYRIKIAGVPVADGTLHPEKLLAVDTGSAADGLPGVRTTDPARSRPAVWIEPSHRDRARALGYDPREPGGVLADHLRETARRHADELLTRDATRNLVDQLRETAPAVVDELIPDTMKLGEVQQVLLRLLREDVPIRQLETILEAIGDHAATTTDPAILAEHVRRRLARSICARYRDSEGRLHVVTLDPAIEDQLRTARTGEVSAAIDLPPHLIHEYCESIGARTERLTWNGHPPVLLVGSAVRPVVKRLTESELPHLVVLGHDEITHDTRIEEVGRVVESVPV